MHEVKEAIVARQRFDTPDSVTSSMSFEVTGDPAAVDEFLAMVRNVLHTNAPAYGLECGITKIEGGKV
ncbi:MAG: hypothetical protein GWO44_26040 [Thermoplasmata archaeon]|nr:hypothetical protein [Thermoplasmata archaeon]NIY06634.1 hypothetical protein [Thermoplasmata archaeon]